jgi:precorrin-2 dehydrogenase/sirohydrochlorin ferrochelatase
MKLLPLALNVQDRRCVVFGAGAVARRKAQSLLECGAEVILVAPRFDEAWANLAIEKKTRPYQPGDCEGALLVFACTNDAAVNRQITDEAHALNIPCNAADDGEAGDFHSMAVVRRGDICVGVSTSGGSPALSRHLKEKIGETIGPEYESLLTLLSARRADLPDTFEAQERRAAFWNEILHSEILNLLRQGETSAAEKLLESYLTTPS